MMKPIDVAFSVCIGLAALMLAGCASVEYQPYYGRNSVQEGSGGTKVAVDGVDFWANGAPPFAFKVLGVATGDVGSGVGDKGLIESAIASKVKALGGDAAIELGDSTAVSGAYAASRTLIVATGQRHMKFEVIRYIGRP
ncbi:hypothetical protein [Achromobacter sp.]|uniref:hypothetical protein n=1 Tax=Achromobacter sp. TaxID=134375 RepID=UPI002590A6AA|nr:hypothetical protein [Achromobacter sp.]